MYNKHNALVAKVIPKDNLLVYDVRDGWEPLCNFLEVPVPDESYPNLNDSQTFKALYFGMMAFGLFYWAVYACAVVGVVYVAMYPEVGKQLLGYMRGWVRRIVD